jgi:predicted TIM-barrel fold metal-dependent hydrolase
LKTLEPREVRESLEDVQRFKGPLRFYDVHVHPFDVIFQSLRYRQLPDQAGVYGHDGSPFIAPQVGPVRLRGPILPEPSYRPAFFMVVVRRLFRHTGPRVLGEQMALAGIDRTLLLPVAPATGSNEWEMNAIHEMFGNDPRFLVAVSVPNSVPLSGIAPYISRYVATRGVRAVKLHPAITGIDLGSGSGRQRAEAMLDGCRESGVPLIVHGGRSYPVRDPKVGLYACIQNLARIKWRDARVPVVIAHAGCYGCALEEMEREVLPTLETMVSANENLLVDTSALEHDALALVLERVGIDRLLFGSDALYEPPWSAMVKLTMALRVNRMDPEASLRRVAGLNPSRFLSLECSRC